MVLCGISTPFGVLFPCLGKVAHALLTRPPLKQLIASYSLSPLDLHVLGTPPAFVLSQDQTLSFNPLSLNRVSSTKFHSFGITVLFALFLFCIVFKVRTGLASVFEAARATSFVILTQFLAKAEEPAQPRRGIEAGKLKGMDVDATAEAVERIGTLFHDPNPCNTKSRSQTRRG